jgi:tetratricopeptide (TPR) repeat protein/transglutaminase-like putative cysteine protease
LKRSARSLTLLGCLSLALTSAPLGGAPGEAHAQRAPASRRVASGARPPVRDEPFEVEQRRLAEEVGRRGASARAMVPLLELWRGYGTARPSTTRAALEAISQNRRLSPAVRAYAAQLLGRAQLRMGDPDASRRTFTELGYLQRWRVIGPFDNEGKEGFAREYEPERLRMAPVDLEARYEGRERPVGWRTFPDVGHYGYVSFDAVYRPDTNVCAYAETFVVSERPQALSLWLGGGGAIAAWWNGTEVLRDDDYRQPDPDRFVAVVGAHQGPNRLLVKACTAESTWGFYARVAASNGERARGLTTDPDADVAQVHAGHGVARLPAAPVAPLAALAAAAAGERASAEALQDLAEFLALTGADDPAEQRARQLAERAADAGPTAERWLLAAELATSRGDASRFIDRAVALSPEEPDVTLAQARLVMSGPSPDEALHLLERPRLAEGPGTEALEAAELRADLYEGFGLEESARATLERAARRAPGSPSWLAIRAHAADSVGSRDQAMALYREALLSRYDDQGLRETVIGDAILRGELDDAMREIDAYRALSNDSVQRILRVAAWYEALERDDEAMGAYRAALELAPEEADAHVAYGRALLRAGQNELAMSALGAALELRPQDAETRELVEHLQPEERLDEAYAASSEELLARVDEDRGYPYRVLQDLTVASVFDSGLGSRFHQFAAQVINDEGGRALRTFPITFDPDVQRVMVRAARVYRQGRHLEATESYEQQLGEPAYRIYYDTRALVVVFPDLQPGDVVEIRYRIDDVAERNQFDDYYGDMHFFQGGAPTARAEYVLITPAARTFFFNAPQLPSLQREERVEGSRRIHRYVADDVPAIRSEDGMPGATETRPYLHVSTYQSWQDVGRWWWGLVHDQLYADESLRRTVRELVADAPDTRTKVQRIYRWVIDHTRYVGLEFGIHGFLPYRVPQIVQRGFGDCKDKASLLYTMLTEAGVEARLVLVRTRRNGALNDLPASLSVFDHAIAYVPELDLFLDGTAEFSGTTEFPQMDQGVTVLVVGPDGAELRRSPVMSPEHNARERRITIELAADGTGRIDAHETVRGHEAPGWRSSYQAEGTRLDRFERAMRNTFAGIEVDTVEMTGLTDYEVPVTAHYRASVPQLSERDADGLRVPLTVMGDLLRLLARTETREHAFDLGATTRYVEDRTIRIPAGHDVAALPEGGRLESPFGVFALTVTREARSVSVHSELTLARDRVEASEYAAFRAFVQRADAILRQRLTLAPERR